MPLAGGTSTLRNFSILSAGIFHPHHTLIRGGARILLAAIILLVLTQGVAAQDSARQIQRNVTLDDTLPSVLRRIDSLNLLNSIRVPTEADTVIQLTATADSLKLRFKSTLDSAEQKMTDKIDSLRRLNLPTDRLTKKLDSLRSLNPKYRLEKVNSAVAEKRDKALKPVTETATKINAKLGQMRQDGGAGANLPENLSLVPLDKVTKLTDIPGISGFDVPAGDLPTLGDTNLPGIGDDLPGIGDLDNNVNVLGDVNENLSGVSESVDGIREATSNISSIAEEGAGQLEDVPGALEERLAQTEQAKAIQKEIAQAGGVIDIPADVADPDQLKQMAAKKVYAAAINHFAGKEKVLHEAMGQLNKLKAKYPHLNTVKDNLPKKMKNAMYGKPLIERIVPGIELQIQRGDAYIIDYNPNVAYRFTGRLLAGAGWNERFTIDNFRPSLNLRVFGPRAFTEFKVFKGFSARLDIEKMNTYIPAPPSSPTPDPNVRAWVWSAFIGIKKQYQFIKRLKGNFQFMYNLYDDHDNSPYMQRLNVRFGFELQMKKRTSKKEVEAIGGAEK
ncbi:MAG TPA: hypothetical protein VK658_16190 [Chryseolinea sp.]|nr:hypothetical protein [Chryseolinea sp.]